jgi:hypothetical protein
MRNEEGLLIRLLLVAVGSVLLLNISSCAADRTNEKSTLTIVPETVTPSSNVTRIPTRDFTIVSTQQFISTFTQTPTTTKESLKYTPTLTPPVTLEPKQAMNELENMLGKPQKCLVPCFWGIIPNSTTLGEAKNLYKRIGSNLTPSFQDENVYDTSSVFEDIVVGVTLSIQDGLVKNIRGLIDLSNYKGPSKPRIWDGFSPEILFGQYGKPSNIEFNLFYPTEPGFKDGIVWYSMVVRYDQYDFAVNYFGGEVKQGKLIHI